MKRRLESLATDGAEKTGRHQDPVPCTICRQKKRRCDRNRPCSNCRSRGLSCVSMLGAHSNSQSIQLQDTTIQDVASINKNASPSTKSSVNENADKEKRPVNEPSKSLDISSRMSGASNQDEVDNISKPDSEGDREDSQLSETANSLEMAAPGHKSNPRCLENGTSLTHSMHDEAFVGQLASALLPPLPGTSKKILGTLELASNLPTRIHAQVLFDHFVHHVNWRYHIIHVPSTKSHLDRVYMNISENQKPNSAHLSLLYTVFGVACYFWSPRSTCGLTREEGKVWSRNYCSSALNTLIDTRYTSCASIEVLQSVVLLSQLLPPNLGASATYVALLGTTVNLARQQNLHRIDSKRNQSLREMNGYDLVDLEVKRRVWWHLASSDWISSYSNGPQCGTYTIHPNQMNVWYPNNVDDNALTSNECQAQPLSAPTEMTFFIFRSEFSELLREITDHASNLGIEVEELGYDDILSFDGKLKDLMNGLPSFFQLDLKRRNHSQRIEEERPYLKWQRGMAHFALHTRLTRLHRPYLVRGSHDPKHAYSRMVCLRSARMVIEMEKNMHFAGPDTGLEPTRLWTVIHHTFIAAVILLVDLLYNFGEPQSKERREEIMACCMTLEKAQAENTVARQGVDELKKVLRCWMVKNDISRDKGEQDRVMNYSVTQARAQSNSLPQPSMPQPIETLAEILNDFMPFSEDTGFDQMGDIQDSWPDAFDFGANFDSHQWTELFRDLECHPGVFE